MDLRGYKLPDDIDERVLDKGVESMEWYQPFIFRDDLAAGSGGLWTLLKKSYVVTKDDTPEMCEEFIKENIKLGEFYSKMIQIMTDLSPDSETFIDIGCNVGLFGFELLKRGKKPTGVDWHVSSYELISEILGQKFEYVCDRYDNLSHTIPSMEGRTFDGLILSAILLHVSDPHYFMGYLSKMIKKGVMITTPYIESDMPVFRARTPWWREGLDLPLRIEFIPSDTMLMLMLKLSGFEYIYRYKFVESDPQNIQDAWGIWMAYREEAPAEAVARHDMELVDFDLKRAIQYSRSVTYPGEERLKKQD